MSDLLKQYNELKISLLDDRKRGWAFHSIFNEFLDFYNKTSEKEKVFFREQLSSDIFANEPLKEA